MAEKDATEQAAQSGNNAPDAAAQQIVDDKKEEADTSQAESTIRGYVSYQIQEFVDTMDDMSTNLDAYLWTDATTFNQAGFFNFIGGKLGEELMNMMGGPTPLMSALVNEMESHMDFAARSTGDISLFINQGFRIGLKYAAWYVRDSIDGLVGDKWQELLGLAADGGNQFIPALAMMGLPGEIDANVFATKLQAHADAYKMAMGQQQEEVKEGVDQNVDSTKQEEVAQEAEQDMMEDEEAKTAEAAG